LDGFSQVAERSPELDIPRVPVLPLMTSFEPSSWYASVWSPAILVASSQDGNHGLYVTSARDSETSTAGAEWSQRDYEENLD
jgi:hypothetical protein